MTRTGVYEWADESVNIQIGCEHNCRYCYARHRAVERFGYCKSNEAWAQPVIDRRKVHKQYRKNYGTVMFPSTHDITPLNLHHCVEVITKLLGAGNSVLIVTKPHFRCVEKLCFELEPYDKNKILFRFTIGSMQDSVLRFWDPGAAKFAERLECLKYARGKGYRTSVSCEPFLDRYPEVTFSACVDYITDSFWIGKLRFLATRCNLKNITSVEKQLFVDPLRRAMDDDRFILGLYEALKDNPLVRWKDSMREVIESKSVKSADQTTD